MVLGVWWVVLLNLSVSREDELRVAHRDQEAVLYRTSGSAFFGVLAQQLG